MTNVLCIKQIFTELQTSSPNAKDRHKDELNELISTKTLNKNDFMHIINSMIIVGKNAMSLKLLSALENMFEDLGSDEEYNGLLIEVHNHLIVCLDSKSKKVRKNSLIILNLLLKHIELEDEDVKKICERLYDKDKGVTKEAIRLMSSYQEMKINQKCNVQSIFKDLLRHDPNSDVRKMVLQHIKINEKTIKNVVERITDNDSAVRKLFYEFIIDKLDLKMLNKELLEYLIDQCLIEREFDYKTQIVERIAFEFNLKANWKDFVNNYSLKNIKIFLNYLFKIFEPNFDVLPRTNAEITTWKTFLEYKEEEFGRDCLDLPELTSFLEYIYKICSDDNDHENGTVKLLFSCLEFYDVYTEENKKLIRHSIIQIISKNSNEEVLEACVCATRNLYDDNFFLKILMKKTLQIDVKIAMAVCKYILKHILPYTELQDVIINDVVLKNPDDDCYHDCIFYYVIETIINDFLPYLVTTDKLEMLTDLFILNKLEAVKDRIYEITDYKIRLNEESVILPIIKLFLSNSISDQDYMDFILIKYYDDDIKDDYIKQSCNVFFNEYFLKNIGLLINIFCTVLLKIANKKHIINHSLFWIRNSKDQNGPQRLFYNICVFLIKQDMSKNEKNIFFSVLNQLDISVNWERSLSKKILYCFTILHKKAENKNLSNEIFTKLLEIDDNEPIDAESLSDVKEAIKQ